MLFWVIDMIEWDNKFRERGYEFHSYTKGMWSCDHIPAFPLAYWREFDNGFCCAVDSSGIIWYSIRVGEIMEAPCMKLCVDVIKYEGSLATAKAVLALSCELQNDGGINARALRYDY